MGRGFGEGYGYGHLVFVQKDGTRHESGEMEAGPLSAFPFFFVEFLQPRRKPYFENGVRLMDRI